MARLATRVPRRRLQRPLRTTGAPHPEPPAADPRVFSPYIAVAGGFHPEDEPARLPSPTVVSSPGASQPSVVRTPHPTAAPTLSPGQVSYEPTPLGSAPGSLIPSAPARSAAQIHHEEAVRRHRRLEVELGTLTPLAAPGAAPAQSSVLRLQPTDNTALGADLNLNRLNYALGQNEAGAPDPKALGQRYLNQLPELKSDTSPSLLGEIPSVPGQNLQNQIPKNSVDAAALKYRQAIGFGAGSPTHPKQTVQALFDPASVKPAPGSVASAILEHAQQRTAEGQPHKGLGPAQLSPRAAGLTGVNRSVLQTQGGTTAVINNFLHQAGWKAGDKQAELKALRTYYGNPQEAQQVYDRMHGSLAAGAATVAATNGGKPAAPVDPKDPFGATTLGNVTVQQLAKAAWNGGLKVRKGIVSTPENRQVLQRLLAAHKAYQASRALPSNIPTSGQLTPEQIGALLVQEGNKLHAHLNPAEVAEGIGVAEAETGGEASEQRQLASFSDDEDAHVGLFAEEGNGVGGTVDERLNARDATRSAIETFVGDERSWNPAWVHWQEIQGEEETGADRAPQYRALAKELVEGGKQVDPEAVKNLVDAKHAAKAAGINPTPWGGDVEGGTEKYVYIRADAKGAVNWVKSAIGTQEGSPRQLKWAELESLGPSEPWCSDFVSVALGRRGVELPGNPNGSWEYENPDWKGGTQLGTDLSKAKPGDLIVYGGGAHIAMYVGNGKVVAGNWGDEVAEYGADEDSRGISAIVRPHYKGGKVKVKAGSLSGSSAETTFGGTGGESTGGAAPAGSTLASTEGGAGQTEAQQIANQQALANFTVPTAPGFAAAPIEPQFNPEPQETGARTPDEWLELLAQAANPRAATRA